jgi:hypothetical protein
MKKLKLLFIIILLSAGLNTQAQNFAIQAYVFEECLPNSVNITVISAPPGATNFV